MPIKFIWKVFILFVSSHAAVCINGQGTVADVIIPPQSVNISLNGVAEFNCTAVTTSFVWRANGIVINDGITQTVVNDSQNIRMSTLRVPVSSIDDTTNITCTGIITSPSLSSNESAPALLQVQGLLNPVSNLNVNRINSTTVLISWSPPFTLAGVPILSYNITITDSRYIIETLSVLGSTTMVYYLIDLSLNKVVVMMIPINLGGAGLAAEYTFCDNTHVSATTSQAAVTSTRISASENLITTPSLSPEVENNELEGIIGGSVAAVAVILFVFFASLVSIFLLLYNHKRKSKKLKQDVNELQPITNTNEQQANTNEQQANTNQQQARKCCNCRQCCSCCNCWQCKSVQASKQANDQVNADEHKTNTDE